MTNDNAADMLFKEIDTNQDGRGFRNWISNTEECTTSNESITGALNHNDDCTNQFGRYRFEHVSQDDLGCNANRYSSCGTRRWIDDTGIDTYSPKETNYYLEKLGSNLYIDSNPKIIRQKINSSPVTLEQRIFVQYLQPPAVPPPGPLIIKEVRPRQPSPPPPLVIREHAPPLPSLPPLILRERPPTPPKHIPSEKIIRTLPALPIPPRSVIIKRFPPPPEKPRDIIIERWIPYGPQPERCTIVEHAPPAKQYPQPSNTTIIYSATETRIIRKYQELGVTPENPACYRARYGSSLLDPVTLVHEARKAGVMEDITPPAPSSLLRTTAYEFPVYCDRSNDVIHTDYSSTVRTTIEEHQ
ncbi:unnamed protein product [Rotaria sp. Silwood1]|nr:unnamed protein product [Rotaria sp. Silwood1]CAF1624181.1 unnamed protein product [Rotaria sp. Silwood1]CAF3867146.1 unnamed protein product [Rotaria sp. Silwood1]